MAFEGAAVDSAALAVAAVSLVKGPQQVVGNLHIAGAKVADLVADRNGWRIGLGIGSSDFLIGVAAAAAAVAEAVVVLLALGAGIAAAGEGEQCPTLPPSPTSPAFSRSPEGLSLSTSGRLSSACWNLSTGS